MAVRAIVSVVLPLVALGAGLAGLRVVEANQARTGRTSLYERAHAWQEALEDPRGIDPRALSQFYVPQSLSGMPDPRVLAEARLEKVDVQANRRRGVTTHVVQRRYGRGVRLERASLTWTRRDDSDPWRIASYGRDEDE